MTINIGYFLTRRAMLEPDKEALVCEDVRRTFAECNRRANQFAHAVQKLGVKYGDRVSLLALNEPEYFDTFCGLGKIGAILVPINYRLAGPEMQYILEDCGAEVFIFGREYIEIVDTFRDAIPARELICISDEPPAWARSYEELIGDMPEDEPKTVGGDDDTLTILYTSGTTGRPKGAMLTHRNYFTENNNLMCTVGYSGLTYLMVLPLFHIGGITLLPLALQFGVKSVMLRSLDPKRFLELLGEEQVTGFGSVPALLQILRMVPDFETYSWDSVQTILVYTAPLPVTLLEEYAAAGIQVRNLYGLTESTGMYTVIDPDNVMKKAGSCGLAGFFTEVRLVDEEGNEVGPEEWGEVLVRGDNVMKGYWGLPEATAETIRDGWLYTGDIAKRDEDLEASLGLLAPRSVRS